MVGSLSAGLVASILLEGQTQLDRNVCGAQVGCVLLEQSLITSVLPIRLSQLGVGLFVLLEMLRHLVERRIVQLAVITSFAVSTGLTMYGLIGLKAVCPLCLTVFIALAVGAWCVLLPNEPGKHIGRSAVLMLGSAVFAIAFVLTRPLRSEPVKVSDTHWNQIQEWPKVGKDREPPQAFVIDFGCRHCRTTMREAMSRGESFYVGAKIDPANLSSAILAIQFAAAYRQKLGERFLTILPEPEQESYFIEKLSSELKMTESDRRTARRWSAQTLALAEHQAIARIPQRVVPARPK
ncbi:MAG: hypothetical protein SFX74_10545 [Fimbriimonadaceae bacterium]|nr:hypothetical protein [Fimbriimonadaceae bacterium]